MGVDLVLTGFPVGLLPDGRIDFRGRVLVGEVELRSWEELRPVLHDPGNCPAGVAYVVYRDVCRPEHRGILERVGLRYDVTMVLPGRAGRECARTHGHCRMPVPGCGLGHPELYHVVHGEGWFVLQRPGPGGEEVEALRAKAGQYVLVPPGWGHVTVNVGEVALAVANWVGRNFRSSYSEFRARRGPACYVLRGPGGPELCWNPAYGGPGRAAVADACVPGDLELCEGEPSYPLAVYGRRCLEFLVEPASWRRLLA